MIGCGSWPASFDQTWCSVKEICCFVLSHHCTSFPVTTFVSKWHFVYFSGLLLLQWINKDVLGMQGSNG